MGQMTAPPEELVNLANTVFLGAGAGAVMLGIHELYQLRFQPTTQSTARASVQVVRLYNLYRVCRK